MGLSAAFQTGSTRTSFEGPVNWLIALTTNGREVDERERGGETDRQTDTQRQTDRQRARETGVVGRKASRE